MAGRIFWAVFSFVFIILFIPIAMVPLYGAFDPVSTPMLTRMVRGQAVHRQWVSIDDVSDRLKASVLMAEDAKFCSHSGIDWQAINLVLGEARQGKRTRGASTITMQLVKNLFLWPSRSYVRKLLEIPLALYADAVLSKRRILEIYLNIAQWGPTGQFGIEAGVQHFFSQPSSSLTWRKATLMAVTLPSPGGRNPAKPSAELLRRARTIEARAKRASPYIQCLYDGSFQLK